MMTYADVDESRQFNVVHQCESTHVSMPIPKDFPSKLQLALYVLWKRGL